MDTLKNTQQNIADKKNTVVFISSPNWSICHVDEPRVRALTEKYQMPYFHLDIMTEPDLSGYFEVLTVPAILIFHDGREVLRQARFLQMKEIEHILQQLPKESADVDYNDLFN